MDALSQQITGFLLLEDIEEANSNQRNARANISNQDELDIFKQLDSDGDAESRLIDNSGNLVAFEDMVLEQAVAAPVPVLFHPRYQEKSPFVWSLDELLRNSTYRINPPSDYYIASLKHRKGDAEVPSEVSEYLQVARFAKLLRDVADHSPGRDQVIFLGTSKLEMAISYEVQDLQPLERLDCLEAELREADHHHAQRLEVFRSTLIDSLGTITAKDRFRHLIEHFNEFVDRYRRDFQIYAKDFTAVKQIEEISKKQLELAEKIDGILSSIQNRLLAVPITLVLAAGQFTSDAGSSSKNILIFTGWVIFALLIGMMISNQGSTLSGLSGEIERLKKSSKELDIFDDVSVKFNTLEGAYRRQWGVLCVVGFVIIVTTLLIAYLFIKYTYPGLIG